MDCRKFNTGLERFKQVLSEEDLNAFGKAIKFAQKFRKITPFRLIASLIASFSCPIESIADIHRMFNELNENSVQYKPFHKQLAKKHFPKLMRQVVSQLMNKLVQKTFTLESHNPFSQFDNIYIHDGTAYGVRATLKNHFPGKFEQACAAVELHTTMNLLEDEAVAVTVTPFKEAENNYLPAPEKIRNSLLLADRCYVNFPYFDEIDKNGGFFIVRGKHHINPLIKEVYINGRRVKKWENKRLKEVSLPKNATIDLIGEWKFLGGRVQCRLIVSWNKKSKNFLYLVTNLSRIDFSPEHVLLAYRLRWQIELLFKEWKSYANLKKFSTSNAYIAEGLIWAALGSAILKRFIAHLAQSVKGVAISTRIVAMCVGRKITFLIENLIQRNEINLRVQFKKLIDYLSANARRTNLMRDYKKGRGQLETIGILKD